MRALEFYIVDELFVMECGKVGGLSFDRWEDLAKQHKVARLHRVSVNTTAGKKFCKNVRIGGLLCRQLSCEDVYSPIHHGDRSPPSLVAPSSPALDTLAQTVCMQNMTVETPVSSSDIARNSFFKWLHGALLSEINDVCDALSLLDCVHVVLGDEQSEESWDQILGSASAVLENDAPICAGELALRWHSAQFAETDAEHTAVVSGHVGELPSEAFFCAGHDCSPPAACVPEERGSEAIPKPMKDMLNVFAGLIVAQVVHAPAFASCQESLPLRRAVTHPSYL